MKITAHVMVKNEYRFLWYSVMSVINFVDKILLWDTGSNDGTLEVIDKILKSNEARKTDIAFTQYNTDNFSEEDVRQKMLDLTPVFDTTKSDLSNWFLVVDGDEVWWEDSIRQVTSAIRRKGKDYESIVIPTVNTVGDMYHYQEEEAGNYHLAGKVGHYNLRGVNRNIEGLHSEGEHGVWGWADINNKQIQERNIKKILYIDAPYLHCTFLERAKNRSFNKNVTKRNQKFKHEIGLSFPKDYYYPEVFFRDRPSIVPCVWEEVSTKFLLQSAIETPLRKIKRRTFPKKIGY